MKLIGTVVLTVIGLLFWHHLSGPWFGIMIVPLLTTLLVFPKWKWAFTASFFAGMVSWGYFILPTKDTALVAKMAELIQLPNAETLVFGTLFLAGILAGSSALFGWSIREAFGKKKRNFRPYR
jgi:hypothetical protein